MQGQYKGFSTLLSAESPNQVHIWCYAHVLNLVLGDTTGVVIASASLFSLLNDVAVFIRESYKLMNMWEEVSEDTRHRRLSPIGETRWWAKDQALSKIFGCFGNPDRALFIDLVSTLTRIEEDDSMKPHVRAKARGYTESLLRFETILTAQIFLRIFEITSPLSKYLQTSGMDLLTAHRLVIGTQESLNKCVRGFDEVKRAADAFVEWANAKLQEKEDCEVVVQAVLPEKRVRRKKAMPGELAEDEPVSDAEADSIKVRNVILDTVTESIQSRYAANGPLCADFACFDPRNFPKIKEMGLPTEALQKLSECLQKYDERATAGRLQAELSSLANCWERLKMPHSDAYNVRTTRGEDGREED